MSFKVLLLPFVFSVPLPGKAQPSKRPTSAVRYLANRAPLRPNPYIQLP
ncbi:hypothetical protein [Spirosoma knui]